jgi:predicted dehydrogenase
MSDNDIRIGVIGSAGRGAMAANWHKPGQGSAVVAAMDISERPLQHFRERIGAEAFTTTDHQELLARDDIDAIAVMSPDFTHEDYVCDALAAGKHVFSEKPMAITTAGCDRMLQAWVDSDKQFMIGFNMRYMNLFRVMKDIVDSGVIGEPKVVWVRHFVGYGGDWYFHDWHGESAKSTSLLLQKASHDIDMIHWLTGQYTKRVSASGSLDFYGGDKPDDLRCDVCDEQGDCVEFNKGDETGSDTVRNQCVFRSGVDVEDNSVVMMELDGGIKATYMQCHFASTYCRNYTIIGTEGQLENLDDTSQVVVKLRERSKRWKNLADQVYDVKPARGGHGGADPVICRDFLEMIRTGKRPIATPLAGRMSVATGCAATESLRDGWRPRDIPALPDALQDKVF